MLRRRALHLVWRISAGAACGAILGYCLPPVLGPNARDPQLPIVFAGIMAVLGAAASGFLSATGWAMLAGGIVGAIVTGLLGVAATLHLKGLIYSFWGAPLGAWLVLQYRLGHETKTPTVKAQALPGQSGVWDADLDQQIRLRERNA